jgi:prepilin-type N-terminal cleavage/methylation domain-containing protein
MKRRRGFTLLEMIAVIVLLGLVFTAMGMFFRDAIGPTTTAPDQNEATRRGLLLISRIARDLEGATLVEKPEEVDPLEHPWLFLAEARRSREGADRLKFDMRGAPSDAPHATDLAVVAYFTEPGDDGDLRLVRWSSPALPESLDRSLPSSNDEGSHVLANGLTRFAVSFVDEDGATTPSWDSTTLERSGKLPISAAITLALADETAPEGERVFERRVLMPIRPIDLEKTLSGESGEEDEDEEDEEDEECVTVGECVDANAASFAAFLATQPDPAAIQANVDAVRNQCAADVLPALGIDIGDCE